VPIHHTAIISDEATVDPTAEVGPYAVIDGRVQVGPGVRVYPHAYITGWTTIEERCQIHPSAVVGHAPQDLAYQGAETYCRIGAGSVIREGASVHRGTDPGSTTVLGQRCFLMAQAHVAHNCVVGDDVKFANGVALAGHVYVGDGTFFGGGAMVHQFVRIGRLCMIAGHASVTQDVPPFVLTDREGRCAGLNVVGLRRAGISSEERQDLKRLFRALFSPEDSVQVTLAALADLATTAAGREFADFVRKPSKRGLAGATRRQQPDQA